MKKENLISKWLDYNLNDQEREAFDKMDASASYRKIDRAMKAFSGPKTDSQKGYERLLTKRDRSPSRLRPLYYVASVAALVVLAMATYVFTQSASEQFQTAQGEKLALSLPDNSEVILNAGSLLSYKPKSWDEKRSLSLEGEAYFKVESGSRFTVETAQGSITVLGTEFNVKERPGYFEVSCFEGKVSVTYGQNEFILDPGMLFRTQEGQAVMDKTSLSEPSWNNNRSFFKSVPVKEVLDELERQYDVEITGPQRNSADLFTGSFRHENLETALQAVTIPLNLTYSIKGKQIILKN